MPSPLDPLPSKWGVSRWGYGFWNPILYIAAPFGFTSRGSISMGAVTHLGSASFQFVSGPVIHVTTLEDARFEFYTHGEVLRILRLAEGRFTFTDGAVLHATVQCGARFQFQSKGTVNLQRQPDYRALFSVIQMEGSLTLARLYYARTMFEFFFDDSYLEIPNDRFPPPNRAFDRDRSGRGGGSRYVSSTQVWAWCPRCGFKYHLSEMREEVYDQKPTGRRVCPECFDQDDPHLALNRLDFSDEGLVRDPLPQTGKRDSVVYAASFAPCQWAEPVEAVLGPFFLSIGGEDSTPPEPPVGPGREYASLDGSLARALEGAGAYGSRRR